MTLLQNFLASARNVLCPRHDHLDLPEITRTALNAHPHVNIDDIVWALFDRLLIYTDGSSQGHLRRKPPLWVEEFADTDAWAFRMLFQERHRWFLDNVVYHPDTNHYIGTAHIGSEHVERESLFWAGLWRLACNTNIPTIFRVDSLSTAQQAMGQSGATRCDGSFVALRSVFQALHAGLGDGLEADHVRSHMNEPWNDMVDSLAKLNAKHHQKLYRRDIDFRPLGPFLPYFWTLLDKRAGLPEFCAHGLDVSPPALPIRWPCRTGTLAPAGYVALSACSQITQ